MWFLLQCVVIFAVMAANVHYGWTPNPYLAALLAIGAAWIITSSAVRDRALWLSRLPTSVSTLG